MDIPSNITSLLEDAGVDYRIETYDSDLLITQLHHRKDDRLQLARVSILHTKTGKTALINGSDALCRLDRVLEHLDQGIDEQPLTAGDPLHVIKPADATCGLPQIFRFPVLIDARLFQAQQLYLPLGIADRYLVMSGGAFKRLAQHFPVIDADLPLTKLVHTLDQPEHDEDHLQQALRTYTSHKITRQLAETLDIPPLSHTAQRILNLSANPYAESEDLIAIVSQDPSLTAQVVGWAASPYYCAPGRVDSIEDAIIRVLGFELVMSLAIGLAVSNALKIPKQCPWGASAFWRQSVYCAIVMEKLNSQLPAQRRGTPGLCYIIGLLNGFGYLVLAHVFKDHFADFCRHQEVNRHLPTYLIDSYLFGISRDQISGQLMQYWNLPEEVYTALRFQQQPDYRGPHCNYANLCFIAQRLLAAKGIGQSPYSIIPADLYFTLGLAPSTVDETMETVFASTGEIDALTKVFTG